MIRRGAGEAGDLGGCWAAGSVVHTLTRRRKAKLQPGTLRRTHAYPIAGILPRQGQEREIGGREKYFLLALPKRCPYWTPGNAILPMALLKSPIGRLALPGFNAAFAR